MQMSNAELRGTARVAFSRYDVDRSGSIDTKELRHLIEDLGGVISASDLKAALRVLDRNKNGVIDVDKFVVWWSTQATDLNGNGVVSDLEKTLERLKEFGREWFHVDIHTAAWNGYHDVVARLVEDDNELVNAKDTTDYGDMNSPLHYAAYQGHVAVCTTLLDHGASVNATNGSGCTPVFYAAQQSREDVIRLLLQVGAAIHRLSPIDVCGVEAITKLFQSLSGSAPAAPMAPTLSDPGETSLHVTWQPPRPKLDQVAPVSLYKLKLASASAPAKTVLIRRATTEAVMRELAPHIEYTCQVAAVNLHGMSDFTRPSPPCDLIAAETDFHSVMLQWRLVQANNRDEEPPTLCMVQQATGLAKGEDAWKTVYKGDASATTNYSYRKYLFRVAASNSTGWSTFSTPLVVCTLPTADSKRMAKQLATAKNVVQAAKQFAALARATAIRPEAKDCERGSKAEYGAKQQGESTHCDAPVTSSTNTSKDETKKKKTQIARNNPSHADSDEEDYIYYSSEEEQDGS
ncbi:Fact complex subunit, partial [Globisporangium splendens]